VQRNLEPDLKHHEEEGVDCHADDRALEHAVLAQDDHEQRDVERRSHVDADQLDGTDVDGGGDQHREHAAQLLAVNEDFLVLFLAGQRLVEHADTGDAQDDADIKGEITGAGTIGGPFRAELAAAIDNDAAHDEDQDSDDGVDDVGGYAFAFAFV